MTALFATGFVLCAWFLGPEKTVASSRRFLKETLDQPNARKIGHQTGLLDVVCHPTPMALPDVYSFENSKF